MPLASPPVPPHTLQAFFRLVYLDSSFLRRFHAQVNNDDAAEVPPWDHTRKRDLTFRTPVNAPQLIANLIQADCIHVIENQSFSILPTGSIQVESTPVPQIPGASNFTSTATILIEDIVDGSGGGGSGTGDCSITATVLVTATGPWGLTSTIESFMATAAQQSLRQFLSFCCQEIHELQRAGALEAALGRIPSLAIEQVPPLLLSSEPQEEEEEEDVGEGGTEHTGAEFYDAEEAASAMLDLAGLPPEEVNEVLSLSLRYVFKSVDENTAILRSIDARLERLEQKQKEEAFTWNGVVEKIWARINNANVETHTTTTRQVVLLAGVALTSAAITTLFYRTKTRNSTVY